MDGSDATQIIKDSKIEALAINRDKAIIYYASSRTIKGMHYLNDHVSYEVAKVENIIISLAASKDDLFFVVDLINTNALMSCSVVADVCENCEEIKTLSTITDVKVYNPNQTVFKNPCGNKSGGCQHICILADTENGYICSCNIDWKLNSDGKTCSHVDEFLLYAYNGMIRGKLLESTSGPSTDVNLAIKINGDYRIYFDYNSHRNFLIYTVDSGIHYVDYVNHTTFKIVELPNCESIPAIDWVSNKLYYVQNCKDKKSYLKVRSINRNSRTEDEKTLLEFGGVVRSLVVHLDRGLIFFIQNVKESNNFKLHSINVDGTELRVFQATYETGLAMNYDDNRLYWLSEDATKVQSMRLDDSQVNLQVKLQLKTLHVLRVNTPKSISVYQKWIYIASSINIRCLDKETGEELARIPSKFNGATKFIHVMKVYSKALQPIDIEHPCASK